MVVRYSQERAQSMSLWLILLLPLVLAGPSQRGKCSLECYSRCMQSGTPSPGQCNCPVERTPKRCSSIEQKLLKAEVIGEIPDVHSEYIDSHTIHLKMAPFPAAFAYIFEYSTISTQPDDWYFAGSSVTPSITFSVLDPCRDYQFRVLMIVRSTNPNDQLVIFRPKAIPVNLPAFSLHPSQVFVDIPPRNGSMSDTLKIYVRWTLPKGYSDGDIYGYEAPALYPIQCHTPEEELPQPKIEIMRSGGRLSITLPSSVLEARCRLWAEVRMLPRCVRLEPHSIQRNIEIDCEKTPTLEICNKDVNPICSEQIEISGEKGKVVLSWKRPTGDVIPLYYHLRYGPAQMKGSPPFVTWQLATKKDVKVEGTVTSIPVDITEDEDFGVQVCAIMTPHRKRAKFGLVRVTPFQCTSCHVQSSLSDGSCGHCGIIEGTTVMEKSWNKRPPPRTSVDGEQQEQQRISQTVFNIGADLTINQPKEHSSAGGAKIQAVGTAKNNKSPTLPLPIERAEEINRGGEDPTKFPAMSPPTSPPVFNPSSSVPITIEVQTSIENVEKTTTQQTPKIKPPKELAAKIVEVDTDLVPIKKTTDNKTITEAFKKLKAGLNSGVALLSQKVSQSIISKVVVTTVEPVSSSTAAEVIEKAKMQFITPEAQSSVLPKAEEIKKSAVLPRSNKGKCYLANGVICEHGCLSRTTCICPPETHDLFHDGGCILKKQKAHSCMSSGILAASWDPMTMNILVLSELAAKHLRTAPIKDRLFVEFGSVVDNGALSFKEKGRQKMVVSTEKLLKAGIFSKEPFIFHVNETIDIKSGSYGMRLCTFDNSTINDVYQFDWDSADDGEIVVVTQLSPLHFANDLYGQPDDLYWATVFQVGKVILLVLLVLIMIGLIYLNCTRIKALYERKRTHYFRPYMIEPQMHLAPGLHRINPAAAGYYDSRSRVI